MAQTEGQILDSILTDPFKANPDSSEALFEADLSQKIFSQINTFSKIPAGHPGAGHTPWTFLDEIVFH